MRRAALLLVLAGCVRTATIGPFVRDVRVIGYDLVIERCLIVGTNDTIQLGACTIERHRLPVTAGLRRPAPAAAGPVEISPNGSDLADTLASAQIQAGIAGVRAAAVACGAGHGVSGAVTVRLAVAASGAVKTVEPDHGDAALVGCLRAAIGAARFAATRRGAAFAFTVALP